MKVDRFVRWIGVNSIWKRLTEPPVSIVDPEERLLSRLLASSLILILPLIILVGMIIMPAVSRAARPWAGPTFLPATIASIITLLSLWLNRHGNYRIAARLYIFAFIFSPWLAVVQDSGWINLPIAILMLGGVLMSSIFTPDGWTLFSAIAGTIVGMLLLPLLTDVAIENVVATLSVIVTLDVLIIVLTYYRNLLEQERQAHLRAENIDLQESSGYNDERLSELIDAIVAMSSLDFGKRAPIGNLGDMYDAVATGINALGEELEASVVSRSELERMIALRTSQLEQANEELSNFAYIASHDLKAPLRAISQLSSWIKEDYSQVLDEQGQEKLSLLINRTKHMHKLIDGILEYSRIGRVSERAISIDLNTLAREILGLLDPPGNIQVEVVDILPVIIGEPTYIAQVFQNLLSNAIRYIDKPQGIIKIGCKIDGEDWVFSVADNGPGIDSKYFTKIFQMFQTLGTRRDADSTGIGLAIVKRIVEKWGGRIWVESTPGEGSAFFFTMPRKEE